MKQIDQVAFDEVYKIMQAVGTEQGLGVYLTLPPEDTDYPFLVIGESYVNPSPTKSRLLGEVEVVVDCYGTYKQRLAVSNALGAVFRKSGNVQKAGGYHLALDMTSPSQITKDDTTEITLYHGKLNLRFRYV